MIRDITIGQYYPADSRIHKLDPRVKIVCTLLYLISLFTFKSILDMYLRLCSCLDALSWRRYRLNSLSED